MPWDLGLNPCLIPLLQNNSSKYHIFHYYYNVIGKLKVVWETQRKRSTTILCRVSLTFYLHPTNVKLTICHNFNFNMSPDDSFDDIILHFLPTISMASFSNLTFPVVSSTYFSAALLIALNISFLFSFVWPDSGF
jgi:hypothetical protein